jgi:hypothetical protein
MAPTAVTRHHADDLESLTEDQLSARLLEVGKTIGILTRRRQKERAALAATDADMTAAVASSRAVSLLLERGKPAKNGATK